MSDSGIPGGDNPTNGGGGEPQGGLPPQGSPAQVPPPYLAAPPVGVPTGVSAKSKKVLVWIIAAAVAFVVLAIGAVVTVLLIVNAAGGGDAKAMAQKYLDAIAKGDATTANSLARVDTSDENNVMLTNAVLSKATRISAPSVTNVIEGSSSELVLVSVSYKLDGKSFKGTVEIDRDSDGWHVAKGLDLPVPSVPYGVDSFRIAGVDGELDRRDTNRVAYPAVYKLLPPNSFYTLSGNTKLLVTRDYRPIGKLDLVPSASYIAAVQKELNAQIDACAALATFAEVRDCGLDLGYPSALPSSTANVAVAIAEYPVVSAPGKNSTYAFELTDGVMSAVVSGPDYRGNPATEDVTAGLRSYGIKAGVENGTVVVTLN